MDQKTSVLVGTILAIFFGLLAVIIAWFCGGDKLEGASREAIRQMFNYELTFLILAIAVGWIPILGQLAILVMLILRIVFAIKCYNAANNNEQVSIPSFNFIK